MFDVSAISKPRFFSNNLRRRMVRGARGKVGYKVCQRCSLTKRAAEFNKDKPNLCVSCREEIKR